MPASTQYINKNTNNISQHHWAWFIYLAIFAGVFFLYAPALQYGYVWDDTTILGQHTGYLTDNWIQLALTESLVFSENYYRPLALLSLFAGFRFDSTSAFLSHAINLSLFFINGLIILSLAQTLCKKTQLSTNNIIITCCFCLCFYLLHPSHIETAVWVSGRFDLMMTTFLLLALLADIKIKRTSLRIVLVSTFFLLAALCKEMSVIFLPVLIVWHFMLANIRNPISLAQYIKSEDFYQHLKVYVGIIIAGLIYIAIRFYALGYVLSNSSDSSLYSQHYGDIYHRIATILKALFLYLKTLSLPFLEPSIQHPQIYPVPLNDVQILAGAFVSLLFFGFLFFYRNHSCTLVLLPFVLFIIALIPVSHIFPLKIGDNIIHERFLAFPVAIFSLAFIPAAIIIKNTLTTNFKKILLIFFLLWCIASAATIHSIIPLWRNSITLWTWTYNIHKNDLSALAYGITLYKNNNFQEAYDLIETIKQKNGDAYLVQANSMLELQQFERAATIYLKAIETGLEKKSLSLALANYAYILLLTKDNYDVTPLLDESLLLAPEASRPYYYYAYYYYLQKNFTLAEESLQNAILHSIQYIKTNENYKKYLKNLYAAELSFKQTGVLPPAKEVLPY